jgi:hypothetical protein
MKLSRREVAGAALAALAVRAQTLPPAPQNAAPLSPEAELQAAKLQVQATSRALGQFEIPMATEPVVTFQA